MKNININNTESDHIDEKKKLRREKREMRRKFCWNKYIRVHYFLYYFLQAYFKFTDRFYVQKFQKAFQSRFQFICFCRFHSPFEIDLKLIFFKNNLNEN